MEERNNNIINKLKFIFMKNKFLHGAAALALCAGFVACSEFDQGITPVVETSVNAAAYEAAFIQAFGQPAADQDWGFGGAKATRAAVEPWNKTHTHDWETNLPKDFIPSRIAESSLNGAVNMTSMSNGDNSKQTFVIPSGNDGVALFSNWEGLNSNNVTIYVYSNNITFKQVTFAGNVTIYNYGNSNTFSDCNFNGNDSQFKIYNYGEDLTIDFSAKNATIYNAEKATIKKLARISIDAIYNAGTINNYDVSSGTGYHTVVYNTGTFTVDKYSNIGVIYNYNGGNLSLNSADVPSGISIYSTEDAGSVELPNGATNFEPTCHIDHIVTTYGDLYIQGQTDKYICGVVSYNGDDNIKIVNSSGGLTTSYIKTNKLTLNGASVYLTNNGYVNANEIHVEGSSCNSQLGSEYEAIVVEPVTGAKAFVKTTSFDLPNVKVFGNHLGAGVYTKFETVRYYDENYEKTVVTKTAEEYFGRYPNEAGKLAPETLGGVSACGGPWGEQPDEDDDPDPDPDPTPVVTEGRIFCEDLGSVGDFDFNDVVFDAKINDDGTATITILAAGGILPISVAGVNPHDDEHWGSEMTNTGVVDGKEPITFTTKETYNDINEIPVYVREKRADLDVNVLLQAPKGGAPQKICVPTGTRWMNEYLSIRSGYKLFDEWVKLKADRDKTFSQTGENVDTKVLHADPTQK